MRGPAIILFLLFSLATSVASAGLIYTGSLSSETGGIQGSGVWVDVTLLREKDYPNWVPATLTWTVSENPDMSWRYQYELTVYRGDISHMIIETSLNFAFEDVLNCTENYQVEWFPPGPSTPGMPDNIYGVKFDGLTETTETITFDSWRTPIWGNFYSKDGRAGGEQNAVWNTGFPDPGFDPYSEPSDGSLSYHILVPDTVLGPSEVIPEPASIVLLLAGLSGLLLSTRNKRSG